MCKKLILADCATAEAANAIATNPTTSNPVKRLRYDFIPDMFTPNRFVQRLNGRNFTGTLSQLSPDHRFVAADYCSDKIRN
jgi:hypothetical protein